jgi:hypothetical protein
LEERFEFSFGEHNAPRDRGRGATGDPGSSGMGKIFVKDQNNRFSLFGWKTGQRMDDSGIVGMVDGILQGGQIRIITFPNAAPDFGPKVILAKIRCHPEEPGPKTRRLMQVFNPAGESNKSLLGDILRRSEITQNPRGQSSNRCIVPPEQLLKCSLVRGLCLNQKFCIGGFALQVSRKVWRVSILIGGHGHLSKKKTPRLRRSLEGLSFDKV